MTDLEKEYNEIVNREAEQYARTLREVYSVRPIEATENNGITSLSHTLWLIENFILNPKTPIMDKMQLIGFVRRALLGSGIYPHNQVKYIPTEARLPFVKRLEYMIEEGDNLYGPEIIKRTIEEAIQNYYTKKAQKLPEENPSSQFSEP